MGHGHGHDHGHDAPRREVEARSVRRLLVTAVAVIGVCALAGLALLWPGGDPDVDRESLGFNDRVEATVTGTETAPCPGSAPDPSLDPSLDPTDDPTAVDQPSCVVVAVRLTSGPDAGSSAAIGTSADFESPVSGLEVGDAIVLSDGGPDLPEGLRYSYADRQRSTPLVVLGIVFALVVVALGRLRGLLALGGILLSLAVLVWFIFPALLDGAAPIGVALTGATLIAFGTLYLTHGVSDRTTVALLGTMASLALTAVLAVGFAAAAELSGLGTDESLILLTFAPDLDFRGLLLAAVIIGTLGVLDDVTITQVAAVWELHRSDPSMTRRQLYGAGIRIGRDHIASAVNTLVLAYAAAALPLLLVYSQSGLAFAEVLTTETVAVEIVQTLVGSIGLVASVPLTTGLACWVITRTGRGDAVDRSDRPYGVAPASDRVPGPAPVPASAPPRRRPRPRDDDFWTNDPW